MPTINSIINELNDVPVNRLEELYQLVHSMSRKVEQTDARRKKVLSFAGLFSEMSKEDYVDFLDHIQKTRDSLFTRDINL